MKKDVPTRNEQNTETISNDKQSDKASAFRKISSLQEDLNAILEAQNKDFTSKKVNIEPPYQKSQELLQQIDDSTSLTDGLNKILEALNRKSIQSVLYIEPELTEQMPQKLADDTNQPYKASSFQKTSSLMDGLNEIIDTLNSKSIQPVTNIEPPQVNPKPDKKLSVSELLYSENSFQNNKKKFQTK